MRRQLTLTAAAVASMIVLAFVVPLGLLVRQIASDRAVRSAEQRAAALVPVLATVTDAGDVARVVDGLNTGDPAYVTVVLDNGTVVGAALPEEASHTDVVVARTQGGSFSIDEQGGIALYLPVVKAGGAVDVIRTFVPGPVLTRGVATAWALLGGLGVALVLGATALADRLGRAVVEPVGALAGVAERLSQGDLAARVEPDGPPEIVEVGETLNRLADRIDDLLVAERESVADLSHRLRTPVTALRLDAESVADPEDRRRLMDDVDSLQEAVTTLINDARRQRLPAAIHADVVAVTRERVTFWSALAEDQGRRWDLDLPSGPCPVSVPGDELAAALDALVGNVLAHTDDGVGFRVSVQAGAQDQTVALVVEDDGPGFPTAADPTRRGHSGGGSTGLGLDIATRTAEAAGGSLRTGVSAAGGARIVMSLPRAGMAPHPG